MSLKARKKPATTINKANFTFQKVITPRNAIAADFIRIVFRDCQWRNDYRPMLKFLLVCKEWFQFVIPLLWRKVNINSEAAAEKFLQTISSPERGHLYKRYLRELDAMNLKDDLYYSSETWIQSVCTCLETGAPLFVDLACSLHAIPTEVFGPNLRRQLEGLTIGSINKKDFKLFPNLKRLEFDPEYTDPSISSIFRDFAAFAPQLTRISVSLRSEYGPSSVLLLESLINVEDLHMFFEFGDVLTDEELLLVDNAFGHAFEDPSRIFLSKLTSLEIDEHYSFWWSKETLFALFRRIRKTLTKVHLESDSYAALRVLSYTGDQQNRKNYVLRKLKLDDIPKEWEEINFANFKALESIDVNATVEQTVLMRIAKSCGKTLLRFSFRVDVRDRATQAESENHTSIINRFLDACPHLEEFKVFFVGGSAGNGVECVFDGVAHSKLRVLRVKMFRCCVVSAEERCRMMPKIWSQCPNLYNIFWDNVCYGRYQ